MTTPSTVRQATGQSGPAISPTPASGREYRRPRQHLFELGAFKAATAVGGTISAYCGIVQTVPKGNPANVHEVSDASEEDCVTCLDVWLGQKWVRL